MLPNFRNFLLATALFAAAVPLGSCGWLAGMNERAQGKSVVAQYHGMDNKSVAIVVYTDPAIIDEFANAREDISVFLATQIRLKMPTVRVMNIKRVIEWQDDTINWFALPEKQIGQHFSVDRVLYVELLDYATHMETGYGDLQGHIRANCKIYETETPGNTPAWTTVMDVSWPKDRPLDPSQTSEITVRKRTVEIFADDLTNMLYDHKEFEKPMSERN